MKLYNLKDSSEQVSFEQAVKQGLGSQQGLFFPDHIEAFSATELDELLKLPLAERSSRVISHLVGDEISEADISAMVHKAFDFPADVKAISSQVSALELFHGPTLAFKDFGGRFMAQCLAQFSKGEKVTILTATSGDTGAAVAHAFYGMENINVVVLYPEGKISKLQEKLFCTLGGNITTISVKGDFDACQSLVKAAFDDQELKQTIGLNSANSINISRLLAQVCYYFEALAQLSVEQREQLVVSVPSGNFGNLTAGLIAKSLGLPIKRFIAATNSNDTVPRYLSSQIWDPKPTQATLSNAMDVSQPNNWPRVEALFKMNKWPLSDLASGMMDDQQTAEAVKQLSELDYLCEPHGAIAYQQLQQHLQSGEHGLFLCTAHPAKFQEAVEDILDCQIELPAALAERADLPLLSKQLDVDFAALRALLISL